jgi:hypothetical protein
VEEVIEVDGLEPETVVPAKVLNVPGTRGVVGVPGADSRERVTAEKPEEV